MSLDYATPTIDQLAGDDARLLLANSTPIAGAPTAEPPPPVTDMSTRVAPSVVPVVPKAGPWALTKSPQPAPTIPGINPSAPAPPSYADASTGPTGMASAMSPSLTKLGKLFTVLRAAGMGAAAGSGQQTFGGGMMAAQENANQQAQTNMALRTQAANLQLLPFLRQQQIQQTQATIEQKRAAALQSIARARKLGAPSKPGEVDGRMLTYFPESPNADENGYVDLGAAGTKPKTVVMGDRTMQWDAPNENWKDVGAAPTKQSTSHAEIYAQLGDKPTTPAYNNKNYGTTRAAQAAWGEDFEKVMNQEAGAKAAAFGNVRGMPVTDTQTGVTAPMSWADYQKASKQFPGRYVTPQFDPETQANLKSYTQAYKDLAPSGKLGTQVTSYNTFLRHVGNLYNSIDELQNSGYPDWNHTVNWLRAHSGDPRVKTFLAKLDPVQKEFQSFLLNNRALYSEDRDTAQKMLSLDDAPQAMKATLATLIHTGNDRLAEANESFKRTTGEDIPDLLSPQAQKVIGSVGGPAAAAQMPPIVPRRTRPRAAAPAATPATAPPAQKPPVGLVPF